MIIDFHTHVFPDTLAEYAVAKLAENARARNYLAGTANALRHSMQQSGIDYSVLLPVATKPQQQEKINYIAMEINEHSAETGLISFGSVHPENKNCRRVLRELAQNGIKGIKLHPVAQQTDFDDISYLRIVDYACENNLIILIHAGYDISYPQRSHSTLRHIVPALDKLQPEKLVLAHMGGWGEWNEVENFIAGRNVWLDTAFTFLPILPAPGACRTPEETPLLSAEQFLRILRRHGTHRILFGTDSPWSDQRESINFLNSLSSTHNIDASPDWKLSSKSLTPEELSDILGNNAADLLGLKPSKIPS